jgi:hypothetical protein
MKSRTRRTILFSIAIVAGMFAASALPAQASPLMIQGFSETSEDITASNATDDFRSIFENLGRVKAYRNGQLEWLGSANIIQHRDGYLRLLTNSHVAGSEQHTYTVELFKDGHSLGEFPAATVDSLMTNELDIAILEIRETPATQDLPAFMPVVRSMSIGDEIFRVGASRGEHPNGRLGHITSISDNYYISSPKAIGGDSGSSVFQFNEAGEPELIALTAWSVNENGKTFCMSMRANKILPFIKATGDRPPADLVEPEDDKGGILQRILDRLRDNRIRNERDFKDLQRQLNVLNKEREELGFEIADLRDDNNELAQLLEESDERQIEEQKIFSGKILGWLSSLGAKMDDSEESQGNITDRLNDSFASVKIIMSFIKIMFWGMVALLVASLFFKQGWATTLIVTFITFFFRTGKLAYLLIHNALSKKNDNPKSLSEALEDLQDGIAVGIGTQEDVK